MNDYALIFHKKSMIPNNEPLLLEEMPKKENLLDRITPFEARWHELVAKVNSLEINDAMDTTAVRLVMKEAQSLSWEVEDIRKYIVAPFNKQVKVINSIAKRILEPIEEAKQIAKNKIVAREEEQERLRRAEQLKISQICSAVRNSKTKEELDEKISKIEENWYIGNADVLLAVNEMIRKFEEEAILAEEKRLRDIEAKRLADIKETQNAEAAMLEEKRIALAQKKRELESQQKATENIELQNSLMAEKREQAEMMTMDKKLNTTKGLRKTMDFEILDATLVPREYCCPDEALIREAIKNQVTIPGVRIFEKISVQ